MTISKKYFYVGDNGTLMSTIYIPKADPVVYLELTADKGKVLTDGVRKVNSLRIREDSENPWTEIDADE